ncbi:DUF6527 family protein [Pseudomonas aeruginosa]|uniref:DUF6527 family protein n=1 Tax=Pseudomonas aeruginosa TaxID=287 RepID=UPI0039F1BDAF
MCMRMWGKNPHAARPTEWRLEDTQDGPSLSPSVGNWQQSCRSHYWIWRGEVECHGDWTEAQVQAGRRHEHHRREKYFAAREMERRSQLSPCMRIWLFIKKLVTGR